MCNRLVLGVMVGAVALGPAVSPVVASDAGDTASLYERLGGVYPIALVIDDFIDRVVDNDTLNANPLIYATRKPQRFPGLKFQLTAMVCQATGGPCQYTGKSMKDAHLGMGITESDWQALMADLAASLESFGVGEAERQELFAIVESTKSDILASAEVSDR